MASRDVFVDSGAFHAMLITTDLLHRATLGQLKRLQKERRPLVTTDYVISETVTLLKRRGSSFQVGNLFEVIDHSPHLSVEWIAEDRFAATRDFILKHNDHDYSFADCTSFIVMRELKITEALTADRHFREAGFEPLL